MADPNNPIPPSGESPRPVPPEGVVPGPPPPAAPERPTEIVLNPRTVPRPAKPPATPAAPAKTASKEPETKDSLREIIETVVFVVVLVLLLKTFLAEAFVIPTGSMATTLLGYNIDVTCDKCGYVFPVNASKQEDPQDGPPQEVVMCRCPNCAWLQRLHPEDRPVRIPGDGGQPQ
jgi:hypothetical protein